MHLLTAQHADEAGFELLSMEARGGSSIVYRAVHAQSRERVALKLLTHSTNPERIQREATLLKQLRHPNIARFIDAGVMGPFAYLATEWVQGSPLRKQLEQQPGAIRHRPMQTLISQLQHIACALEFAHEAGIVHGDVNPNNILVTDNNDVRIIDFGLSRINSEAAETVTQEIAGTPRYLAPEIIMGHAPAPASDQYALALVAYEMLSGHWPFSADKPIAATALHHQLYTRPSPISELRPDLPVTMDAVFAKALNKSPVQRFDSVQAFFNALSQAANPVACTTAKPWLHAPAVARCAGWVAAPCIVTAACLWLYERHRVETQRAPQLAMVTLPADCNLYVNAHFDDVLEENFFRDAENDRLAMLVSTPDIPSAPALQLGDHDVYGIYGKIIEISGGQSYSFSADLTFKDYVHDARLTILWLDKHWQTMEGEDDTLRVKRTFNGTFLLTPATAPEDAHYAVPTLYKDASAGVVFADNVQFSEHGESCD